MKILVAGGHIIPALAVIQALPKDAKIVYVGRKTTFEGDSSVSAEYQTITKLSIPFIELSTGRLQRKFSKHTIPSLLKTPKGIYMAMKILKKEKPDIVISFGGYLSIPIGFAAYILRIPLYIHEETQEIGLANKLLAKFARNIFISWPTSKKFFPENKTILTGNPILKSNPSTEIKKTIGKISKKPLLCIVGGSGGSHAINSIVEKSLPELLKKYTVIHQTGNAKEFGDFERLQQKRLQLGGEFQERYYLYSFISPLDIEYVFQKSDVVIGRSGINTVTLLLKLWKRSLLIPLPISQRDEQFKNAKMLEDVGIGKILLQKDIQKDEFIKVISALLQKPLKEKQSGYLVENAAEKIVHILYDSTTRSNI